MAQRVLLCFVSRTTLHQKKAPCPEESTSAEPKGIISAHETEMPGCAFLKDYVEWDR